MVLRGTTVSGDNYWKGAYDHANAVLMTETYQCPDPFALTEMEDVALAVAAERLGMLDRYIIIRDSVNMDVFMNGASPPACGIRISSNPWPPSRAWKPPISLPPRWKTTLRLAALWWMPS